MPASPPRVVAVVPARFASERLPGKPLAELHGKPMVVHVLERAARAEGLAQVLCATDDERIATAVRAHGFEAVMTDPLCMSGTDRVAEVARGVAANADVLLNIQGDEPLLDPRAVTLLATAFRDPAVGMATLCRELEDEEEIRRPQVVKVVTNLAGDALYFSRSRIPFDRSGMGAPVFGHLGLYGFRRDVLARFAALPPSPLETTEKLEQLRALENGIAIRVLTTRYAGFGVDTPEDLERARALLAPQTP